MDSFNSLRNHDLNDERVVHVPTATPNPQHHPSMANKLVVPGNANKREISLPKTRVSSRGQLYLSTGDRKQPTKSGKSNVSNTKSYAKKWIEDISNNVAIDPADLLDEHVCS